jgi:hypothetical protein
VNYLFGKVENVPTGEKHRRRENQAQVVTTSRGAELLDATFVTFLYGRHIVRPQRKIEVHQFRLP